MSGLPKKTNTRLALNRALRKAGIPGGTWGLDGESEYPRGSHTLTIQPGGEGAACCELVFSKSGAILSAAIFGHGGDDLQPSVRPTR